MDAGFEHFEHTADLGTRVWAPSLVALVEPATRGFYSCIGEIVACGGERQVGFEFAGDDPPYLLHDYLTELLHCFETQGRIVGRIGDVQFDDRHLSVRAGLCDVDRDASALQREVKAITYHELDIRQVQNGYEATFIVDI